MGADYKSKIKEMKYEAGHIMTSDQLKLCNGIIHTASVAAAAGGAIPIPIADAIPITATQITMVMSLGKVFRQNLGESAVKSMISAAAATFAGRNLVKLIPIIGWGISAAVAAGITEAIGWIAAVDFAKKCSIEYKRKTAEANYANTSAEYDNYKRQHSDATDNEEAEDFDA